MDKSGLFPGIMWRVLIEGKGLDQREAERSKRLEWNGTDTEPVLPCPASRAAVTIPSFSSPHASFLTLYQ